MNTAEPMANDQPALEDVPFRRGFEEATTYLATMPTSWARHHAQSTLEVTRDPDTDVSYARGYRAALHGYLRSSAP